MSNTLLRDKADAFAFLCEMKTTLFYKATEAEDLHNEAAADIRAAAEYIGQITKKLAMEGII